MKLELLRRGVMKRLGLSCTGLVLAFGLLFGFGSKLQAQTLPSGPVFAFSQDANTLAIAGEDGRVTVLDLASGQERATLAGDSGGVVTDLVFSPDGEILAGVAQGTITLWNLASGQERATLAGDFGGLVTGLAFSPDGKTLAGGVKDNMILVWDVDSGTQQRVLSSSDDVNRIAFSPDGTTLASSGRSKDIKIWDVVSGREHLTLTSYAAVTDLVFSPVGMTLASVDVDDNITLWDIEVGYHKQILTGHRDLITGFAFSPDGTILASGGKDALINLWQVVFSHGHLTITSGAAVNGLAFSPDGKTLASAMDDTEVMLWEVSTGKLRRTLTGHADFVASVVFSSDGRTLASVGKDGEIITWDIATGAQQITSGQVPVVICSGVNPVGSAPTGMLTSVSTPETSVAQTKSSQPISLAAGNASAQTSVINEASVLPRIKPLAYNKRGITALAISQDGTLFASAGQDGTVRVWDAVGRQLQSITGHLGALVSGVAFSADGKRMFSSGRDTAVRSWDVTTGKQAQKLRGQEHPIRALAASADGKFLATAGEETRIMFWDAATGRLNKILSGHIDFINGVTFSADGTYLASGGADDRVVLWDVKAGKLVRTLLGHSGEVNVVAFSPNGRLLASAGQDTQVLVWDVVTGRQILTLAGHQAPVRTMAFSPDGQTLVSSGEDSRLLVWHVASGRLRKAVAGATGFVNALIFRANGNVIIGTDDNRIMELDIVSGRILNTIAVTTQPLASRPAEAAVAGLAVPDATSLNPAAKLTEAAGRTTFGSLLSNVLNQLLDWVFPPACAASLPDPDDGPGGPILVINSASSIFGKYYAEILRNEGFNAFAVADIATITQGTLAGYNVVLLAAMPLSAAQVTMLSDWVNAGGNLIAMRPDQQLAGLLGLTPAGSTLLNGYLLVDTSRPPGNGIVGQTIQFHGTADRYTLNGASILATLYTDATTATSNPALTLHDVGTNGGQAAAFTFDLSTSIVYTRQGNPAWAAQERDGYAPIRSDDKFYGDATGEPQPDWVDLNKVAIPQADEQQRLLVNLILEMNLDKKPLPRFWYFPRGKKAVVIMTGDDHGNGGTAGRFDQFKAQSPAGCSVANWECMRGTSYIYTDTPLTDAQAAAYTADGFEVGLHINTNCADFTPASLETFYTQQISYWTAKYTSIPPPLTQRHHCIVWSDWLTGAKVQLNHGIRLDTNYYFWPPGWILNRPGFFTGSGMPMRFADLDGTLIDVYHAETQMTDESGQQYPYTIDTLLDRALGAEGYYGAFTVNAHTDLAQIPESDAVVTSALARGVPIVSGRQMMDWLDGRNSSSFGSLAWSGNALSFTVAPGAGTNGLQALVPMVSKAGVLTSITRDGGNVIFTTEAIKGIEYAFFSASAGAYVATYAPDTDYPTMTSTSPANGAAGVNQGTTVTATFSEAMNAATVTTATFELRGPGDALVPASVTYGAGTRTATLTPAATLAASTAYIATVKGGATGVKDLAGNALAADFTWSFTTAAGPSCPCSGWSSSTTPTNPSASDPNAVELGVKFRSNLDGFITGLRFYKGTINTGTHVGNLWTAAGQLLATATFTSETATGWQEVSFASPVAITANTMYVASYFAPNGGYAFDSFYFANSGFQNGPLYFLRDGENGGNGVYVYSASTSFPANTWQSANYWVDVVFTTSAGPETTPPTVTAFTIPATATTLTVAITSFSATDNVGVTGYLVNESAATPSATADGWLAAAPASYTFTTEGSKTLYAWAKDAAGNISASKSASVTITLQAGGTEPAGWYAGDMHVHRSCGGSPEAISSLCSKMSPQNLAVISLLADMGNGEVQNPVTDLPLVNGQDASVSTPGRIVHWDAEWHWDATYNQYPHQAMGGHVVALGLTEAHQIWEEYTYPIFNWAHQQNAIAGFVHMQYLDDGIPQDLNCCKPIEYPVEVALGSADFIAEDVNGGESAIQAYYRLLNCGFRPSFTAGTDYPCGVSELGSLLTYVQVAGGQMTYPNWIQGIKGGRTVVSRNGHNEFLNLTVNTTATPGDEIKLTGAGSVQVTIIWTANQNLTGTIELVRNGVVVASQQASVAPGSPASLSAAVDFAKSGWLAARRMGSNGHQVHTAAVFVTVNNAPVRASAADAQFYVDWMDNLLTKTSPGGAWNSYFPTSLSQAQARYQAAKALYQQIALEAGGSPSPTLSSITVTPGNQTIQTGTTRQFTATGNYSDGSTLNITAQTTWASSNTSIASINRTGLAIAVNPGTTTISATLSGVTGSTSLTVQATPLTLTITTQSLPDGTLNISYSATLTASGGTAPYTWSIAGGSLPTGLSLNNGTGVISGMPTATGNFSFTAQATDSGNPQQTATKTLSITISTVPDTTPPTVTSFTVPATATTLTVSISSFAATDNIGVTGYMATESATAPSATAGGWSATAPASYTFTTAGSKTLYAWAKDAAGNVSASKSASVTITLDTTPPTVPASLSATSAGTTQINLTWSASTDNVGVSGYEVERCQGVGCANFAQVATVTGTSFGDSGLTAGTTYQYRLRAADAAGNLSGYSNVATATTQVLDPPPGTPSGLSATASDSGVSLQWSANSETDLAGYHVYRRPGGTGSFTRLNASLLTTPAFEDTLAPAGASDYTITAVDKAGNESAQATPVSVTMGKANRILNPGFELDANNDTFPDNWSSNARFTRNNILARSGAYGGRHFATNNAGYTISQAVSSLTAGTTYTFAGWVNIPTTGDKFTFTLRIQWRNASNTVLRTDTIRSYTASTNGWNKAAASLVAPTRTANAQVQMVVSSLNATIYVDDFALR